MTEGYSFGGSGRAGRVEQNSFILVPSRRKLASRIRQQTSPRALTRTGTVLEVEDQDLDSGLFARPAQPIDLGRSREEPPCAAVLQHVLQGGLGKLGVEQNRHGAAA